MNLEIGHRVSSLVWYCGTRLKPVSRHPNQAFLPVDAESGRKAWLSWHLKAAKCQARSGTLGS